MDLNSKEKITGNQLLAMLAELRLTESDLAKYLGVTSNTVYTWSNSGNRPISARPLCQRLIKTLYADSITHSDAEFREKFLKIRKNKK